MLRVDTTKSSVAAAVAVGSATNLNHAQLPSTDRFITPDGVADNPPVNAPTSANRRKTGATMARF